MPARVTDTGLEGSGGGNTGGSRAAASRRGRTSNSRSYLPSHGQSRENLVQEVREGSSLRRDSQRIERASHPLDEAILDGMLPVPEALKDEPAKLKKKKVGATFSLPGLSLGQERGRVLSSFVWSFK